jgi:hypothetical protein
LVSLLGAPLRLSQRIRTHYYTLHRRLGPGLVAAGLLIVILALIFALRFPWGGTVEAMATAILGCWFLTWLKATGSSTNEDQASFRARRQPGHIQGCDHRDLPGALIRIWLVVAAVRREGERG